MRDQLTLSGLYVKRNRDLCHDSVSHIRRVVWPGNCATRLRNTPAHRTRIIGMHSDSLCSEKTRDNHCYVRGRIILSPDAHPSSSNLAWKKRRSAKNNVENDANERKLKNNAARGISCNFVTCFQLLYGRYR